MLWWGRDKADLKSAMLVTLTTPATLASVEILYRG